MQHAFAEEGEGMKKNRLVKTNILIGLVLLTGMLGISGELSDIAEQY